MPALSPSDDALIRSGSPIVKYYLAVMPRTLVFSCSLNNGSATYGLTTLAYDNVTVGAWGDVVSGQTLEVVGKGTVRIRSITSAQIKVAAQYDIEWEDDDVLRVLNVFEPWARPTGLEDDPAGIIYYKDTDITWVDNETAFPPVSYDLGAWAGFYDTQESIGIAFDAASAYATAPGATIATYDRPVGDGAFIAGSQSSAQAKISFPVGFRWVTTTVTDSNSKTAVMHTPVWVFGGGYQPFTDFSIKRRTEAVRDCELSIEAFGDDVSETDFPEGSMIVLFTRTYINGVEVSIERDMGCPFENRAHIKFVGYVLKDSVRWDAEEGTVAFDAVTVGKIADDMPGYPTFLKDVSTDDAEDWHDGEALTVRSTISFMLRWHTNLLELVPFEIEPVELIAGRKFPRAAPFKQIENALLMGKGVFARLGVSRWGTAHIRYDPQELSDTDRSARATVMGLDNSDWLTELTIDEEHRPQASSVFGGGIAYDGAEGTPLRGRSPGIVGRQSSKDISAHNLIIDNQADLNLKLGRLLGAESIQLEVQPLETFYDVFSPALQEYVTLTVGANENPRELALNDAPFIVREVQIESPSNDTPVSRLRIELLAGTLPGFTVAIPDPPDIPNPMPPPSMPPIYIPPEPIEWPIQVIVGTISGGVYYTGNFSGPDGGQPTWVDITGDLPELVSNVLLRKLQCDPDDPIDIIYVQLTASYDGSDELALYGTQNGGVNWVRLFGYDDLPGDSELFDFAVDPDTGRLWVVATDGALGGTTDNVIMWYSDDYGSSWNSYDTGLQVRYGIGGLEVLAGRTGLGRSYHPLSGCDVIFSPDGVSAWDDTANEGFSTVSYVPHALSPEDNYHYFLAVEPDIQLAKVVGTPDAVPALISVGGDVLLGFLRKDQLWFGAAAGTVRYIRPGSFVDSEVSTLFTTEDHFSAALEYDFTGLYNIIALCWRVEVNDETFIIYGADGAQTSSSVSYWPTKHAVGVALVTDPTDFTGKAGEYPDTPPYTDSIPSVSDGPCVAGIQVIE